MINFKELKLTAKLCIACVIIGSGFFVYNKYFDNSDEIILNGNVEIEDVNLSFRVAGRVKKIFVDEGDIVKTGDTIASLETDILEANLQLAAAQLLDAKANLIAETKNFERNKDLYKKNSSSEKTYDDSKMKYDSACAKNDAAKATYNLAYIALNDALLKSPADGVILTRGVEVGEMISAGNSVFSISPNNKVKIKTYASSDVLVKIKTGDVVSVGIDSLPNKRFNGHLAFISSEAEFTPKNIETKELRTSLVYRLRVIVDDANAPELKQGMPVTVFFAKN